MEFVQANQTGKKPEELFDPDFFFFYKGRWLAVVTIFNKNAI